MLKTIIFLDFDGVLNSCEWFKKRSCGEIGAHDIWEETHIDPSAVARVNTIIEATGCDVCISSAWRCGHSMGALLRLLVKRGMDKKHWDNFVGATPVLTDASRGAEIQAWLDGEFRDKYDRMVIIDDGEDMAHLTEHAVWTHGITGLTDENAKEIIRRLIT